MKEIIYLDTKLVNSFLAQMNEGLLTKLITEEEQAKNKTEYASTATTKGNDVGFNTPITAKLTDAETITDAKNIVLSTSNKELIESALDDYSLDVLISNLLEKQLLKKGNYSIGDIVMINDEISVMNFDRISKSSQIEIAKDMFTEYIDFINLKKEYNKANPKNKLLNKYVEMKKEIDNSGWNNFQILKSASEYMNQLFPNNTLIKIADTLSICPNELFRVSEAQLTFLNYTPRDAKIIGIISSKIDVKEPSFENQLDVDYIYKNAPNIFSNIMLGSNDLIEAGDFIIRPIAIYFEY
ncbi:DUF6414 family protein [Streptococcus agalactiae]|uniref:DUF6414 family protein n=1 Tax=Streptococcus agalactiae TaxID=1311 RepID=UPI00085BDA06|nr:hypothetical protein [Streptococcus agalactiae]